MALSPIFRLAKSFALPRPIFMTLLLATAILGFNSRQAQATIYYVATTGSGLNSGLSWQSPKSDLNGTIHTAVSGDQVWVEAGTYTGNFTASDGVVVYGGFAGTETSISQRNIAANPTILNGAGTGSGKVYTIPSSAVGTNTLDGFTVENGLQGLEDASRDILDIANCVFINNGGGNGGGNGVTATGAMTTITGCTFTNNSGSGGNGGSGIDVSSAVAIISASTFTDNSGSFSGAGGGIRSLGTNTTITDCTFTGNSAMYSQVAASMPKAQIPLLPAACSLETSPCRIVPLAAESTSEAQMQRLVAAYSPVIARPMAQVVLYLPVVIRHSLKIAPLVIPMRLMPTPPMQLICSWSETIRPLRLSPRLSRTVSFLAEEPVRPLPMGLTLMRGAVISPLMRQSAITPLRT